MSGRRARAGFTLIEVMAAMVVFSTGVLMMLSVTRGLSRSLEHSAISSLITADGQECVDSLMAVGYAALGGTRTDTLVYRGMRYKRTHAITQFSPLVKRLEVRIEPVTGPGEPSYDVVTFRADAW